jgi:hypothetical protein
MQLFAHSSVSRMAESLPAQLHPLKDVSTLSYIFSYLPYSYLTLASVAQTWRVAAAIGGRTTSIYAAFPSLLELQQAWPGIRACLSERPKQSEKLFAYHLIKSCGGACVNSAKEMIAWVSSEGLPSQKHLCIGAAAAGRSSLLKWLHCDLHCPWNAAEVADAASTVAIFKFVWKQAVREAKHPTLSFYAASRIDREAYLISSRHGQTIEENLADVAVTHGSVELLEWLTSSAAPNALHLRSSWFSVAAAAEQYHVMDWLVEQVQDEVPMQMNEPMDRIAAGNGGMISILQRTSRSSNASPQSEDAILHEAAFNCRLPVLRLLHSKGIGQWSAAVYAQIMSSAGLLGCLNTLQWARHYAPTVWPQQLWEWDKWHFNKICWQLNCLQWAIAEGYPWGDWPAEFRPN